jgi:hypothetical protein
MDRWCCRPNVRCKRPRDAATSARRPDGGGPGHLGSTAWSPSRGLTVVHREPGFGAPDHTPWGRGVIRLARTSWAGAPGWSPDGSGDRVQRQLLRDRRQRRLRAGSRRQRDHTDHHRTGERARQVLVPPTRRGSSSTFRTSAGGPCTEATSASFKVAAGTLCERDAEPVRERRASELVAVGRRHAF